VGVPSLEVLSKLNLSAQDTLVLMDARKGKAYAAIYGAEHIEPCAVTIEEALTLAQSGRYFVVSDKNIKKFLNENSLDALEYETSGVDFGKFLFEIAQSKLASGEDFNWAKIKPLYIQPPPISMPKK